MPINGWGVYLMCANAGNAYNFKPLVFILMVAANNEVRIKTLTDGNSTLLPGEWITDGTYLYAKRQSGVIFSILPFGGNSFTDLEWVTAYPSSGTEITPIVNDSDA